MALVSQLIARLKLNEHSNSPDSVSTHKSDEKMLFGKAAASLRAVRPKLIAITRRRRRRLNFWVRPKSRPERINRPDSITFIAFIIWYQIDSDKDSSQ